MQHKTKLCGRECMNATFSLQHQNVTTSRDKCYKPS